MFNGCYAWDVPEGWWRVKYEKESHETVWSDWLPVPPPQTDVNIGMVSTAPISYSIQLTGNTTTSAELSLTNRTASSAFVRFVVAAYDQNGKMVAVNTTNKTLTAAGSTELTVSYSANSNVGTIKAFVLSPDTSAPLRGTWSRQISG